MLLLWGLLLLTVWMVLARGIPSYFAELRGKPGDPMPSMPPIWSLLVSAVAIFGIDFGYRNLLPQSESHEKLQELVRLVDNNDYRGAVKKLQDIADDPHWREPVGPLEPRQHSPF